MPHLADHDRHPPYPLDHDDHVDDDLALMLHQLRQSVDSDMECTPTAAASASAATATTPTSSTTSNTPTGSSSWTDLRSASAGGGSALSSFDNHHGYDNVHTPHRSDSPSPPHHAPAFASTESDGASAAQPLVAPSSSSSSSSFLPKLFSPSTVLTVRDNLEDDHDDDDYRHHLRAYEDGDDDEDADYDADNSDDDDDHGESLFSRASRPDSLHHRQSKSSSTPSSSLSSSFSSSFYCFPSSSSPLLWLLILLLTSLVFLAAHHLRFVADLRAARGHTEPTSFSQSLALLFASFQSIGTGPTLVSTPPGLPAYTPSTADAATLVNLTRVAPSDDFPFNALYSLHHDPVAWDDHTPVSVAACANVIAQQRAVASSSSAIPSAVTQLQQLCFSRSLADAWRITPERSTSERRIDPLWYARMTAIESDPGRDYSSLLLRPVVAAGLADLDVYLPMLPCVLAWPVADAHQQIDANKVALATLSNGILPTPRLDLAGRDNLATRRASLHSSSCTFAPLLPASKHLRALVSVHLPHDAASSLTDPPYTVRDIEIDMNELVKLRDAALTELRNAYTSAVPASQLHNHPRLLEPRLHRAFDLVLRHIVLDRVGSLPPDQSVMVSLVLSNGTHFTAPLFAPPFRTRPQLEVFRAYRARTANMLDGMAVKSRDCQHLAYADSVDAPHSNRSDLAEAGGRETFSKSKLFLRRIHTEQAQSDAVRSIGLAAAGTADATTTAANAQHPSLDLFRQLTSMEEAQSEFMCPAAFNQYINDYYAHHQRHVDRLRRAATMDDLERLLDDASDPLRVLVYQLPEDPAGTTDRMIGLMSAFVIALMQRMVLLVNGDWPELEWTHLSALDWHRPSITSLDLRKISHGFTVVETKLVPNTIEDRYKFNISGAFSDRIVYFSSNRGITTYIIGDERQSKPFREVGLKPTNFFPCLYHAMFVHRTRVFTMHPQYEQAMALLLADHVETVGVQIRLPQDLAFNSYNSEHPIEEKAGVRKSDEHASVLKNGDVVSFYHCASDMASSLRFEAEEQLAQVEAWRADRTLQWTSSMQASASLVARRQVVYFIISDFHLGREIAMRRWGSRQMLCDRCVNAARVPSQCHAYSVEEQWRREATEAIAKNSRKGASGADDLSWWWLQRSKKQRAPDRRWAEEADVVESPRELSSHEQSSDSAVSSSSSSSSSAAACTCTESELRHYPLPPPDFVVDDEPFFISVHVPALVGHIVRSNGPMREPIIMHAAFEQYAFMLTNHVAITMNSGFARLPSYAGFPGDRMITLQPFGGSTRSCLSPVVDGRPLNEVGNDWSLV